MLFQLFAMVSVFHGALAANSTEQCEHSQTPCMDSSRCVPRQWICDGEADCLDASDEEDCARCGPAKWVCADQTQCVHRILRCDGREDCNDGSDESCPVSTVFVLILNENGRLSIINTTDGSITVKRTNTSADEARAGDLAYDPVHKEVYWSDMFSNSMLKMGLDGRNITSLFSHIGLYSRGMEIDAGARFLFYSDEYDKAIYRYNIDTGDVVEIVNTRDYRKPRSVTLDVENRIVYWTIIGENGGIFMTDYDGESTETLTTDVQDPSSLALGFAGLTLFWLNRTANMDYYSIMKMNLATKSSRVFFTNLNADQIDTHNGLLYVIDRRVAQYYMKVPEKGGNVLYYETSYSFINERHIKVIEYRED